MNVYIPADGYLSIIGREKANDRCFKLIIKAVQSNLVLTFCALKLLLPHSKFIEIISPSN